MDQLRTFLSERFGSAVKQVYIRPPASKGMEFPCVLISRAQGHTAFAVNNPYRHSRRYTLTGISSDPDSGLYDLLVNLPRCAHDRSFPADNLNHDVFTIFFEEEAE
jgi:hypothetical protein